MKIYTKTNRGAICHFYNFDEIKKGGYNCITKDGETHDYSEKLYPIEKYEAEILNYENNEIKPLNETM